MTIESIESGLLKDKNDIPVLEEMIWSLGNDTAAQNVIGKQLVEVFSRNHGSYDRGLRKKYVRLFLSKLGDSAYL